MSKHSEQLDGIDQLSGRAGQRFDIRFHLHPTVSASITQNGNTAILKLPKGGGWQFDSVGADLSLEDSIFLGQYIAPRNSLWFRARPRPRRPKFPGRYTRLVNVSPAARPLLARDPVPKRWRASILHIPFGSARWPPAFSIEPKSNAL